MKAADFHISSDWMNESLKLRVAYAAVDAALIRKLWPEKLVTLIPICERAYHK